MKQFLVDIALPVPIDRLFTYIVPLELQQNVCIGNRVLVPFGKKHLTGIIVGIPASTDVQGLKPLVDILDEHPTFSEELLSLTRWISEYYFSPWGEVLRAATPQGLSQESKKTVQRILPPDLMPVQLKQSAPRQYALLKLLEHGKAVSIAQIQRALGSKSVYTILNDLQQKGWVRITDEITATKAKPRIVQCVACTSIGSELLATKGKFESLPQKQQAVLQTLRNISESSNAPPVLSSFLKSVRVSLSTIRTLSQKGYVAILQKEVIRHTEYDAHGPSPSISLNPHQAAALQQIMSAVDEQNYRSFLLHGVTGSGKTQVYIEAIRYALSKGKTAIVLVPEISLTPQTVRRFKAHFRDDVAVMHSQMSIGERFDAWRLAHQGKVKIIIGPRSAIFAPLNNLGLVVVDEEHESSYKQFDATPRYHARDVALIRARHAQAVVVLGSATPSIESYYNATQGKHSLLELPQRVDSAQMPVIEIVDMAKERKESFRLIKAEVKSSGKPFPKRLPDSSISRLLQSHIASRLEKKEGVILLQNRRGFSHVMECFECGYVERCENCDVTLTYHATKKHLRCHYCGFVKSPPTFCPVCKQKDLRLYAFGTQQVHDELQQLFPEAKILRMDRDTTSRKGAHDKILLQFESGEADILLGTQMVAKGLDFPRVTLVGVISADTQMLLPDFRASESTFQLLTQVAGRAGRSNLAGEVVIQTLQPEHYSLTYAAHHDFHGFFKEEATYRQELDYPPFSRIVLIEFSGIHDEEVQRHAKKFMTLLAANNPRNQFLLLGPADAAIPKIKKVFRQHVVIKNKKNLDPSGSLLRAVLQKTKAEYAHAFQASRSVKMIIDVDPQGMM